MTRDKPRQDATEKPETGIPIPYGVYFNLPFDEYLADPALSQSGIKRLLVSPLTYWADSSMNPDRDSGETPAKALGSALHKRILEGVARFDAEYDVAPDKARYPDAVDGADSLREMCREYGLKVSGTIPEMCCRILSHDPGAVLWPDIMNRFKASSEGKIILKPADAVLINRIAAMVESDETARNAFVGGFSEVSVFWPDATTGVRMKARFDYLKSKAIVDLKTFSNTKSLPLDRAIAMYAATYQLPVQAVVYLRAVTAAKAMILKGLVYGESKDHPIIYAFLHNKSTQFFFVFVETGSANNIIVREFRKLGDTGNETLLYQSGKKAVDESIAQYKALSERFGTAPWNVQHETRPFNDEEFPPWVIG